MWNKEIIEYVIQLYKVNTLDKLEELYNNDNIRYVLKFWKKENIEYIMQLYKTEE